MGVHRFYYLQYQLPFSTQTNGRDLLQYVSDSCPTRQWNLRSLDSVFRNTLSCPSWKTGELSVCALFTGLQLPVSNPVLK